METIKDLRKKINAVDQTIIKKLSLRNKLVIKIGKLKEKTGKKITDIKRERELMFFYEELSKQYQLEPSFVKKLFILIIANSRKTQK